MFNGEIIRDREPRAELGKQVSAVTDRVSNVCWKGLNLTMMVGALEMCIDE